MNGMVYSTYSEMDISNLLITMEEGRLLNANQ